MEFTIEVIKIAAGLTVVWYVAGYIMDKINDVDVKDLWEDSEEA